MSLSQNVFTRAEGEKKKQRKKLLTNRKRFEGICKYSKRLFTHRKKGSLIKYSHANEIVLLRLGFLYGTGLKVTTEV